MHLLCNLGGSLSIISDFIFFAFCFFLSILGVCFLWTFFYQFIRPMRSSYRVKKCITLANCYSLSLYFMCLIWQVWELWGVKHLLNMDIFLRLTDFLDLFTDDCLVSYICILMILILNIYILFSFIWSCLLVTQLSFPLFSDNWK